jgi:hypothetical protein
VFVEGSPQHVLEMVVLEDHIEEEVVLEVLAPPCVYTFICVEIKTNTETVAPGLFQKVQRTLGSQAQFFFIVEGVFEGAGVLPTNPMSL